MKFIDKLKQLFCKHEWEYVKKINKFQNLQGDMIYKRCCRCGKIVEYKFMTNEEQAIFFKN